MGNLRVRNVVIGVCAACGTLAAGAAAKEIAAKESGAFAPFAGAAQFAQSWAPLAKTWASGNWDSLGETWAPVAAAWAPVAAEWASASGWGSSSAPSGAATSSTPRGVLGITVQPGGSGQGVVVGGAPGNMPAAKAGIKQGDRIVAIDGRRVNDVAGLRQIVRAKAPGETVVVVIVREGEKSKVRVTLAGAGTLMSTTPHVLVRPRAEAMAPGAPRAIAPRSASPRGPVSVFRMPEGGNWSTAWPRQAGTNQELNAQIERLTRQINALNRKIDAMQRRIDAGQ